MDIEWWKSLFEVGGVALLFLTFAFGAGFMLTGKKVNERQSERLRKFDSDLTEAQTNLETQKERAATAEGKIAGLQQTAFDAKAAQQKVELELEKQREITAKAEEKLLELAKRQAGRRFAKGSLSSLLKAKAVGTVKIQYQPDDTEAFEFAMSAVGELSDVGWKVAGIERIPDNASMVSAWPVEIRGQMSPQQLERERQLLPVSVRAGGGSGLAIVAKSIQDRPADGAYEVLREALLALTSQIASRVDPTLPEDTFILVVGPKP